MSEYALWTEKGALISVSSKCGHVASVTHRSSETESIFETLKDNQDVYVDLDARFAVNWSS